MKVVTEEELRKELKNENLKELKEFLLNKGQIITPAAISFLNEHNIVLKYESENKYENKQTVEGEKDEVMSNKVTNTYQTIFGVRLNEKPEYMTHLNAKVLVFKDHKRIIFRGKLDSLEAKILEAQIVCHKLNLNKLVQDLQEILLFVRDLVRCEVLDEEVKEFNLQGMDASELREKSHHPKKYFGIGHEAPEYTLGEAVVALNSLRTNVRETELAAFQAFKDEYGTVTRVDIIRALNRLSSLLWIMMYKFRVGNYSN